jgi:hypothetical protein
MASWQHSKPSTRSRGCPRHARQINSMAARQTTCMRPALRHSRYVTSTPIPTTIVAASMAMHSCRRHDRKGDRHDDECRALSDSSREDRVRPPRGCHAPPVLKCRCTPGVTPWQGVCSSVAKAASQRRSGREQRGHIGDNLLRSHTWLVSVTLPHHRILGVEPDSCTKCTLLTLGHMSCPVHDRMHGFTET